MKYFYRYCLAIILAAGISSAEAQFSRQDTLRGTITPQRAWWDVLHYDVTVIPDYDSKTISGKTTIQYKVLAGQKTDYLQVDLQKPLHVDTIFYDGKLYINYPPRPYFNDGNTWMIPLPKAAVNSVHSVTIAYHGKPREAVNPPWDGGWIWKKDDRQRPWMSVACQGLGASVWYPCKDHQSDEPDKGARLTIIVPDATSAIGNGRMASKTKYDDTRTAWTWEVKSPINNYNIIPYIGYYTEWKDQFNGEKGTLDLNYWVLDYNVEKSKAQFGRDVKPMLECFEKWFGPYPFYDDGFKLVESPHLGMEHQSAIAYGNHYMNGYLGSDLSGSGWGKNWDYIIVHESGHEWFANNVTTKDIADMWVHEGFTTYSEVLFVECQYGKEAADAYCQGSRKNIGNDKPIIGTYGVNSEGSGDMYPKGANLLHTIRQVINDDAKFRGILRGLNRDFYHSTTTSKEVEAYFSRVLGKNLSKIFDQYLRTKNIPVLEYKVAGKKTSFRWTNCVNGFDMPLTIGSDDSFLIKPTTEWSTVELPAKYSITDVNKNYFITLKKAG